MSSEIDLEEEFARTRMTRAVFFRLIKYLKPYRRQVLWAMFGEMFWVISFNATAHFFYKGLKSLEAGSYLGVQICALAMLFNAVFRMILVSLELKLIWQAGMHFLNDLRDDLFKHIHKLSMRYFDRTKEGRIIARVDRDVECLEHAIVWGPLIFVSAIFSIIVASVLMAVYNWKLYLAVAAVLPVLGVTSHFFRKMGMAAYRRVRESMSIVTAFIAETVNGVRVLQGFSRQHLHQKEFAKTADKHADTVVHAAIIWNAYWPSINTCYALGMLVVLGYGGHMCLAGEMGYPALVAYIMLVGMLFWPIEGLGELYNASLSAASGAERIFLLLDTEPEVIDAEDAVDLDHIKGNLVFKDVDFAYDTNKRDEWSLRDISFEAKPGQTIALVGPTGAGKSSIVNLAARFYEPLHGQVTIDGYDSRKITLRSLHSNMGIVLQENFLFTGTVMENLLYGNDQATEETAVQAVKDLGAYDILSDLNNGFDTEVKERGGGLSQGERQLICFARAMIADPAILVLDEATASVDTHTELVLQGALERLCQNRMTLIVAHRLSTIRQANQILVVVDGGIIERGTHGELLAKEGRYHDMYQEFQRKGVMV
ncbi:ABC transporter ATP-binding protein [Planctomycetota bacterium]